MNMNIFIKKLSKLGTVFPKINLTYTAKNKLIALVFGILIISFDKNIKSISELMVSGYLGANHYQSACEWAFMFIFIISKTFMACFLMWFFSLKQIISEEQYEELMKKKRGMK